MRGVTEYTVPQSAMENSYSQPPEASAIAGTAETTPLHNDEMRISFKRINPSFVLSAASTHFINIAILVTWRRFPVISHVVANLSLGKSFARQAPRTELQARHTYSMILLTQEKTDLTLVTSSSTERLMYHSISQRVLFLTLPSPSSLSAPCSRPRPPSPCHQSQRQSDPTAHCQH